MKISTISVFIYDNDLNIRYLHIFLKADNSNSTIISADPTDNNSLVIAYRNINTFYPGQTNMIRFNLTLTEESKHYKFQINASSSVKDHIELVRFYIANLGSNFPCLSQLSSSTISQ